jgi:histidyl-tRNA synthetase
LLPGDDERAQNKVSVKNFMTGEQQLLDIDAVVALLK